MGRLVSGSLFALTVVVVLGLAACGGSKGKDPRPVAHSSAVVARVGSSVITAAMVNHWLAVEKRREALVPPEFAACVAHLRAIVAVSGAAAKPSAAQLRGSCETLEEQLREEALTRFIVGDWVTAGARELGVDVGGPAFQRDFAAAIKSSFHTQARLQSYLKSTGRDMEDLTFLVRRELDSEAIREAIQRSVGPVTAARVRKYYEQHRSQYFFQQTRDVEIAATPSRAEALAVRRRIAAGQSFASVVKGLSSPQAVLSKDGLVLGLRSGYYKEQSLNHAIFTARPGVLSGPVKTVIGYFVFRLNKVHPAYQESLASVAGLLKASLPNVLAQQALVAYIKSWRAKWTARTSCSQAYVIAKCRQFKPVPGATPEDAYTLN